MSRKKATAVASSAVQVLEDAGIFGVEPGQPNTYADHLRVDHFSVGTYSVPAGGVDDQRPHDQDELYVAVTGRATLTSGGRSVPVAPGTVVFVPAREAHRFTDVTEDLSLLVFFAPPYSGVTPAPATSRRTRRRPARSEAVPTAPEAKRELTPPRVA